MKKLVGVSIVGAVVILLLLIQAAYHQKQDEASILWIVVPSLLLVGGILAIIVAIFSIVDLGRKKSGPPPVPAGAQRNAPQTAGSEKTGGTMKVVILVLVVLGVITAIITMVLVANSPAQKDTEDSGVGKITAETGTFDNWYKVEPGFKAKTGNYSGWVAIMEWHTGRVIKVGPVKKDDCLVLGEDGEFHPEPRGPYGCFNIPPRQEAIYGFKSLEDSPVTFNFTKEYLD